MYCIHPVRILRFASSRTQPLESLSVAVKLPIKKRFWATQPWNKSWTANSCYANWVYYKEVQCIVLVISMYCINSM